MQRFALRDRAFVCLSAWRQWMPDCGRIVMRIALAGVGRGTKMWMRLASVEALRQLADRQAPITKRVDAPLVAWLGCLPAAKRCVKKLNRMQLSPAWRIGEETF
ncbi:hypothetical protein [Xanthomonas floridensis]|uniref:Uncharacterized protein n=1 Tax=Xanthomonas floridensis TaxID=1843580 RepID=A0ABU5Q2G0_9XANT|nr:hypothetical protein [Xanthomonas floridensis]MEA5125867.1 hypothetical protein [Xanthomonas floridensis]MEA5133754.1 hypothetical protein [Xanthomonas floridensis]